MTLLEIEAKLAITFAGVFAGMVQTLAAEDGHPVQLVKEFPEGALATKTIGEDPTIALQVLGHSTKPAGLLMTLPRPETVTLTFGEPNVAEIANGVEIVQ